MKRDPNRIDINRLRAAASTCDTMKSIATALGISRNKLRYLLYTKYDEEDANYTRDLRLAFYEGRSIYKKNKIKDEYI